MIIHSPNILFGAFALTLPVVPEDPKETQIIAQDMVHRPYYKWEDGNLNRQSRMLYPSLSFGGF